MNRQTRKWQEKHRQYKSQYQHGYFLNYKLRLIAALGGKCVRCGFSDFRALQFDHIRGGGVKELKAGKNMIMMKRYLQNIDAAKKKIQILCANCNWIKRFERNENPRIKSNLNYDYRHQSAFPIQRGRTLLHTRSKERLPVRPSKEGTRTPRSDWRRARRRHQEK
jgi:hypothetical protein